MRAFLPQDKRTKQRIQSYQVNTSATAGMTRSSSMQSPVFLHRRPSATQSQSEQALTPISVFSGLRRSTTPELARRRSGGCNQAHGRRRVNMAVDEEEWWVETGERPTMAEQRGREGARSSRKGGDWFAQRLPSIGGDAAEVGKRRPVLPRPQTTWPTHLNPTLHLTDIQIPPYRGPLSARVKLTTHHRNRK
jgi:hypothetical protein